MKFKKIQAENVKTSQRIHNLEEKFNEETYEDYEDEEIESIQLEGLFSCTQCRSQFGIKEHFENHMKEHKEIEGGESKSKCEKCEYVCQRQTTLGKHINTKHAEENSETGYDYNESEENKVSETTLNESDAKVGHEDEEVDYLFQIEIAEGETIFACNVCDEGFENIDNVRIHIADKHIEVLRHVINEEAEEDKDDNKERESSCDDSICLDVGKCVCKYLED